MNSLRNCSAIYRSLLLALLLCSLTHATCTAKAQITSAEALFDACDAGNLAKVRALLDLGISPNAREANGLFPLFIASAMNRLDIVRLLIAHGADVNQSIPRADDPIGGATALMMASGRYGNVHGWVSPPSVGPEYGDDAERFARAHPKLVKQYALKADAWFKQYHTIMRLLLDHGANVNAQSSYGETAIVFAATDGGIADVQLLLTRGARLDLRTHARTLPDMKPGDATVGFDALVGAARPGNDAFLKLLLAHGASPDARAPSGDTPLTMILSQPLDNYSVAALLLHAGANPNAPDAFHNTPMSYVRDLNGETAIKSLLARAGAK